MRFYTNGRIAWVPVFKNASTSIKQAVIEAGWSQTTSTYEDTFAVVRHPVDRWWSGIHQYHLNNQIPHSELFEEAQGGKFVFDQHTKPQDEQIPDGSILVAMDDLHEYCRLLDLELPHLRARSRSVESPDLVPSITDYYATDFELYAQALERHWE